MELGVLPQGRGTPSDIHHRIQCVRFILADAGNSWLFGVLKRTKTVYPRWRGELDSMATVTACPGGLSPLARGTLHKNQREELCSRFIPAGAGNSHHDARATRQGSVYPRWRGELISPGISCSRGRGLSPLARGTLPARLRSPSSDRFIPAGAGNSGQGNSITIPCPVYPRWRGELAALTVASFFQYGLSPLARGTPIRPRINMM